MSGLFPCETGHFKALSNFQVKPQNGQQYLVLEIGLRSNEHGYFFRNGVSIPGCGGGR
jgi:hypothetical protein